MCEFLPHSLPGIRLPAHATFTFYCLHTIPTAYLVCLICLPTSPACRVWCHRLLPGRFSHCPRCLVALPQPSFPSPCLVPSVCYVWFPSTHTYSTSPPCLPACHPAHIHWLLFTHTCLPIYLPSSPCPLGCLPPSFCVYLPVPSFCHLWMGAHVHSSLPFPCTTLAIQRFPPSPTCIHGPCPALPIPLMPLGLLCLPRLLCPIYVYSCIHPHLSPYPPPGLVPHMPSCLPLTLPLHTHTVYSLT